MKHNKFMLFFAFLLITSLVLTACQPETIIQTVEVTKEVEKVVKETQVVEVEVERTVEVEVETTQIVEVEAGAFTTPHPILSDVRVRQAMAHCTNKVDVARAGYPLLEEADAQELVMHTMIPRWHWAYAGDENITIYEYDVEKGKALLEEAGYSLAGNVYTKEDGTVLALKFYTTTAAFRQAWAAVWERQMAECGIQILRSHVPASWWFGDTTGLAVRDFELGAYAWVGQIDPGGTTLWTCDQIPLPENGWEGQNTMGWCNEAASTATYAANNTLVQEERIRNFTILQQEYTKDVPAIPLFNRTETFAVVSGMTGFDPLPGEEYYTYNVHEWAVPGRNTLVFGYTQEPASMYALVEQAMVQRLADSLMGFPRAYTTLNNTYEALYYKELPTLESGLAVNNEVEVNAGDTVVAAGEVVEVANGVMLIDAEGNEVEFTGSPVTMHQMSVTYEYLDGITWQDGTPVSQADVELSYAVTCDRESGATSFYVCDRIQDVEFEGGTRHTITWLPGFQDPEYFAYGLGFAPAHRPIEAAGPYQGQTLGDVPAKDWPTLFEVAERPWSFGPYIMTDWVKGERMTFEPNPHFYGGEVATPNIVISFITSENAEAQLLGGQVDLLDGTTLADLTQTLVDAEAAGTIRTVVNPSATWEHIDFNLFIR